MYQNLLTDSEAATDAALKAKHSALWALGDYPAVATRVIAALGPRLVDAAGIVAGDRVLDVAAGSGNAAIPAAARGATVTASDLTPRLLQEGARRAAELGLSLDWQVADAEALPFEDNSFDTAVSCVGIMFAPHHQRSADEVVRVVRPGGRLATINWTPEGFIGQMFAAMKPYAPPPPPGAQPPPLWGNAEHVEQLFGARVKDLRFKRELLRVECFDTPEAFRDFFKRCYGPTISTYRAIADQPNRVAQLDDALAELARTHDLGGGVMEWEYLLCTATVV